MLATATARNDYVGAGNTGPFPYTFKIYAASDLRVVKRNSSGIETVLNYPADFSVTGVGNPAGGNVTTTVAVLAGERVAVRRFRPLTQTTDLRNQSTYFREDTEDALDKLTMVNQQQQDAIDRSLHLDESLNPAGYDLSIPAGPAGYVLGWDLTGTALTAQAPQAFGFATSGLADIFVTDVIYNGGADKTGVLDATAAFNLALAAGALGARVIVPAGNYKITGQLNIPSNVKLEGVGWTSILNYNLPGGIGILGNGVTNTYIESLAITGLTALGIVFTAGSTQWVVRKCSITGCTSSTHATGYAGAIHAWASGDDVLIEDNYFFGNGNNVVGHLASDIQINGNGIVADCSKRIRMLRNRCMSTLVQTNIAAYDCAYSEAAGNVCTGAIVNSALITGYGIMFYGTVNHNAGSARRNRIVNNLIYNCQGNGVYVQAQNETVVANNNIENVGFGMDDTTLACGGISFSSSPNAAAIGNVLINCYKAGITMAGAAGTVYGFTITGNTIDTVFSTGAVSGFGTGILFRGPIQKSVVSGNTIKDAARGIATPVTDQGIVGCSIIGNTINGTTGGGAIEFYGVTHSIFSGNTVHNCFRDGIAFVGACGFNTISNNQVWDGSIFADNTYSAFALGNTPDSIITGNIGGNTGGTGFKWGMFVPNNSPRSVVANNKMYNCRTANYNVDTTVQISFFGNYDNSIATNPQTFAMRQQAVLQGTPTSVTQLLLGDLSSSGAIGTRVSGADTFITMNAQHLLGVDTWHQNNGAAASKLLIMRTNGNLEFYNAVAGTADGNFATFWGTVVFSVSPSGALVLSAAGASVNIGGVQILKARRTGYTNLMTGTKDRATAYDTSTITLQQLAQRVGAIEDDLHSSAGMGVIGP